MDLTLVRRLTELSPPRRNNPVPQNRPDAHVPTPWLGGAGGARGRPRSRRPRTQHPPRRAALAGVLCRHRPASPSAWLGPGSRRATLPASHPPAVRRHSAEAAATSLAPEAGPREPALPASRVRASALPLASAGAREAGSAAVVPGAGPRSATGHGAPSSLATSSSLPSPEPPLVRSKRFLSLYPAPASGLRRAWSARPGPALGWAPLRP